MDQDRPVPIHLRIVHVTLVVTPSNGRTDPGLLGISSYLRGRRLLLHHQCLDGMTDEQYASFARPPSNLPAGPSRPAFLLDKIYITCYIHCSLLVLRRTHERPADKSTLIKKAEPSGMNDQITPGEKLHENNVSFTVIRLDPETKGSWLVLQCCPASVHSIPKTISMSQERLIEIKGRQVGARAQGELSTIGMRVGDRWRRRAPGYNGPFAFRARA